MNGLCPRWRYIAVDHSSNKVSRNAKKLYVVSMQGPIKKRY